MPYTYKDFSRLKELYRKNGLGKTTEEVTTFLLENFVDDVATGEEFLAYKTKLSCGERDQIIDMWKTYLLNGKNKQEGEQGKLDESE